MKKIALLGNPNVGKTTLFNALTGSNQRVGNWAGVTVTKKEGFLNDITIVDLPGIYALDTFSNEEKVSKSFIENEEVDAILNIVDASNLERNLYLTTQLKQYNIPIILVLNMVDVAEEKGVSIDYKKLGEELNVITLPVIAAKSEGIDKVKDVLLNTDFEKAKDGDKYNFKDEKEAYDFISTVLSTCKKEEGRNKKSLSDKLDKIFLNPILAYPLFFLMMFLTFQVTFKWVGQPISDWMDGILNDSFMPFVSDMLQNSAPWFQSLIVDGIIAGVGGILVLLPIILSLFVCISFLEDSGYMARVAFIMDKLMRKMGLSGKAFIPMIVGFGCSVPAIMSARTLESEKDRKLTALLVPLMSCNARLPVYAVFASVFFKGKETLVVGGLYLLGIILAFLLGILFKNTIFKKDEEPFIIELPNYKAPDFKSLILQTLEKGKSFIIKAGTLIFAMSVVIWFLTNFNFSGMVDNVNDSLLASIGRVIAPVFAPLGFGHWESSVSLLSGLLAKETVVASMEVIFAGDLTAVLPTYFTALSALSFLVFVLLYTPCVSVIGAMKKEYGGKMALFSVGYQLALAWIVSFLVYNIGNLIV